jgi:hypothetical protein
MNTDGLLDYRSLATPSWYESPSTHYHLSNVVYYPRRRFRSMCGGGVILEMKNDVTSGVEVEVVCARSGLDDIHDTLLDAIPSFLRAREHVKGIGQSI